MGNKSLLPIYCFLRVEKYVTNIRVRFLSRVINVTKIHYIVYIIHAHYIYIYLCDIIILIGTSVCQRVKYH